MRIEETNFPPPVLDILKKELSILNPPQAAALNAGLLERKNIVVASPTASGKTMIAELAILKNFLASRGKAVYIVPLKALASEKYREFVGKYKKIGMKIAISIGDLDGNDTWLENYDLIIASNEKMDSLLRHEAKWVSNVSLVVCDEVHMLNDVSRGPTLEIVLTRMRDMCDAQFLALSATIKNAEEIAEWMKANLVKSDYRPVKLYYGVAYPDKEKMVLEYEGKGDFVLSESEPETALSRDVVARGKQALFFVSTRRSAEAAAERIAEAIHKHLGDEEKAQLKKISDEALHALPGPTKQCRRLSACLAKGAAFHHAGLVAAQRTIIEDNFRSGIIKILAATPTLAFGINLPAWRVYIRDVKRFSGYGSDYLPVLEVQQMCGRAGRPKYDTEGEAILVAKNSYEKNELKERYVYGEPEPIYSKLSVEPVLRMHVLALVASKATKSKYELSEFFEKTFFSHQYKDVDEVMKRVEKVIAELASYGFVETEKEPFMLPDFVPAFALDKDYKVQATRTGRRVSELYVDPASAFHIISNLKPRTDFEFLSVINKCMEMRPMLRVKKNEYEDLEKEIERFGITTPDVWDVDYEEFAALFKTSLMFNEWMNEASEEQMMEKFGIAPGELHVKINNAEWLLYAGRELALVLGRRSIANRMNRLRLRIKHGVKEELLRLVKLRGVGRVRARMLFRNGIKSAADIKNNFEKAENLLGKGVARQIMEEVKSQ
ncbi:MAG: DEAD/DEAH box helicase [Candidatus Aenigmarchaeota archaeon]|nr:DEAD/DEAH box helicase [Candidatus Aenigmarchaeota archaeon]